jgi:hypothetical protein
MSEASWFRGWSAPGSAGAELRSAHLMGLGGLSEPAGGDRQGSRGTVLDGIRWLIDNNRLQIANRLIV